MMTNWRPSAAKAIPAKPNTIAAVRAYFIGELLLVGAQEIATNPLKHAESNSGNLRTSCRRLATGRNQETATCSFTSSVTTSNEASVCGPNEVVMATSV